MLTQIINGHILTPQGWMKDGSVLISDGKILEITNSDLAVIGATVVDARGMYIVPGLVAMHVHGGGGSDFTEATPEAFRTAAKAHLAHGATTIFPTLSSSSFETLGQAVGVCQELMKEPGSTIMGLHIEGPYLNPKMAGELFADQIKAIDAAEYQALIEKANGCIKRWDISPELEGGHDFARYMRSKGVMVALTHTEAEYDEIKAAYEAGFTHAAHFYNAMPGFHKRREYKYEGTVESVYLMDGMSVEVIADGRHLPSTILRLVYKLKGVERTCLVSDALAYAACEHPKVDPRFVIEDGVCKLADHSSLAGSLATMDRLVQTMVKAGVPFADAIRMASETPAKLIGVDDRKGTLQKGKDADILIFDRNLNLRAVWSMGVQVI